MMNSLTELLQSHPVKGAIALGVFLGLVIYAGFIRAPIAFPAGQLITIEEGSTIQEAANLLEEKDIISSSFFLSILAEYFSDPGVQSGSYSFEKKLSVFKVWHRVTNGITGAPTIRITIPEGTTTREMAEIFSNKIPDFDPVLFRELAGPKEGYLFPETYIVAPGITEESLIALMEDIFAEKIAEIEEEIDVFGESLHDIVTMASLLEREARRYETKRTVAGILWKRIEIGMPLQVDAVFGYIYDTDTFSPTFDQLTATDSPYNTYQNRGLPPGPIASPGLESLRAAVNPIETPYLYYLTGVDGFMHYGRTFDEHIANRRFLR